MRLLQEKAEKHISDRYHGDPPMTDVRVDAFLADVLADQHDLQMLSGVDSLLGL